MVPRAPAVCPLLLLLAASAAGNGGPAPDLKRVRWVVEHAVAVRSIDPADEDFSDLLPLVRAIGAARVVQLGEATHGDGTTFLAKGRLVRFLHQVMGFDVLAWETGLFDLRRMDAALRAGVPSPEAARRGIYPAWHNRESMTTIDYVRASQATERPIESVGFDCRVGVGANRKQLYPEWVFAFFDRLDPALLSPREREEFRALSLAVGSLPMDRHWKPEMVQHLALARRLIETIDRRRGELLVHYPPREIDFARRTLVTLINTQRAIAVGGQGPAEPGYSRDAAMAENLLWWLEGPLAGRKVIVWAHNYHVMNHPYLATDKPQARGGPMGRHLKTALGADLYTIGFTSHGGSTLDGETEQAVPVAPHAFEALLHAAGRPYLFLDLAGLPPGHWLREPWKAGFYMYWPSESRWPMVYDGVFFIDVQQPATPLPPAP